MVFLLSGWMRNDDFFHQVTVVKQLHSFLNFTYIHVCSCFTLVSWQQRRACSNFFLCWLWCLTNASVFGKCFFYEEKHCWTQDVARPNSVSGCQCSILAEKNPKICTGLATRSNDQNTNLCDLTKSLVLLVSAALKAALQLFVCLQRQWNQQKADARHFAGVKNQRLFPSKPWLQWPLPRGHIP